MRACVDNGVNDVRCACRRRCIMRLRTFARKCMCICVCACLATKWRNGISRPCRLSTSMPRAHVPALPSVIAGLPVVVVVVVVAAAAVAADPPSCIRTLLKAYPNFKATAAGHAALEWGCVLLF